MTARAWFWLALLLTAPLVTAGCARLRAAPALPERNNLVLDQLVIHSSTPLPERHRLLGELQAQRSQLSTKLALAVSQEPIHVYLFPSSEELDAYMRVYFPG